MKYRLSGEATAFLAWRKISRRWTGALVAVIHLANCARADQFRRNKNQLSCCIQLCFNIQQFTSPQRLPRWLSLLSTAAPSSESTHKMYTTNLVWTRCLYARRLCCLRQQVNPPRRRRYSHSWSMPISNSLCHRPPCIAFLTGVI